MVSLPGSLFWEKTYGFTSFDDFYERVGRHIPSVQVFGLALPQEAVADVAWVNPVSGYGVAAQVIAAARGAVPADDPGLQRTQAAAVSAAVAGGLETMSQLIIPNCFQVSIQAKAGSQDVINVVGLQNGGGNAHGAALAVQTAWKVANGPLAKLSNFYSLSAFYAVDIGSANGAIDIVTDSALGGVTLTASFATAGACALVKWNGATRSKSSRGRLYYGPIMEQDINTDGRTLVTGSQTTMNTAFTNFRNSLSSSGYPLVVLSRKLSQAFPVTSHAVETVIATQRRRIRS